MSFGAMAGTPIATELRTSMEVRFVPIAEVTAWCESMHCIVSCPITCSSNEV